MAKGFPTHNPASSSPGIRPPQGGGLMEYLRKNFPDVYARVSNIPRHPTYDMKNNKETRKKPLNSGRYP